MKHRRSEGAGGDSKAEGERRRREGKTKKDCSDRLTNCFVLLATLIKKFTLRLCHDGAEKEATAAAAAPETETAKRAKLFNTVVWQPKRNKERKELCKCQLKYEKPQIITTKTSRNIASNIICCFARFVLIVSHRSVTPARVLHELCQIVMLRLLHLMPSPN